jgi:hypothetical protein
MRARYSARAHGCVLLLISEAPERFFVFGCGGGCSHVLHPPLISSGDRIELRVITPPAVSVASVTVITLPEALPQHLRHSGWHLRAS